MKTLSQTDGTPTTILTDASNNDGTFIATASIIYYTNWTGKSDSTTKISTRTGTQAGIVRVNGTTIQAPRGSGRRTA